MASKSQRLIITNAYLDHAAALQLRLRLCQPLLQGGNTKSHVIWPSTTQVSHVHLRAASCTIHLHAIFEHCPRRQTPRLDQLRPLIPERLLEVAKRACKGNKADFGLFSATWWVNGNFRSRQHPCVLDHLEIDTEVGGLADDSAAAQKYRDETIRYSRYCLGFPTERMPVSGGEKAPIAFFKVIEDAASEFYQIEHREAPFEELGSFWQTSELEQRRRLNPNLPTLDEYVTCHMGTSAVDVTCFFNE
ncbi:hypothetical protein DL771_000873 [Monosporascus sp. 5C6A]|nr:hypothetical protein DL771_000873 [Monosporascus sp. 5C6A]